MRLLPDYCREVGVAESVKLVCSLPSREEMEHAARETLEQGASHRFSDQEWTRIRGRLHEYCAILRSWEKARTQKQI
jgi:hypothetical protein